MIDNNIIKFYLVIFSCGSILEFVYEFLLENVFYYVYVGRFGNDLIHFMGPCFLYVFWFGVARAGDNERLL